MKHIVFDNTATKFKLAILIKETALKQDPIEKYYLNHIEVDKKDIVCFSLDYSSNNKANATLRKECLSRTLKALDALETKTLYVCDNEYFKTLTGVSKTGQHLGYVLPCTIKDYEHMKVILGYNYTGMFYNPKLQEKLDLSLVAVDTHCNDSFVELGSDVIHSSTYLKDYYDIKEWLEQLHMHPVLQCDIEAFSLNHYDAGIATIGFAWDNHNGIVIECDLGPTKDKDHYSSYKPNTLIRNMLKKFFMTYKGRLVFHGATYDIKVIIYTLWMEHLTDQVGLLEGLEYMTRDFDCTRNIAYLATNSCEGNDLGLKTLAHEFTGNYAQGDINDIRLIPIADLTEYNLVDCLATGYVFDKYHPIMIADDQGNIYAQEFKPYLIDIIQMELTGMPMSKSAIAKAKAELLSISEEHLKTVLASPSIQDLVMVMRLKLYAKDYITRVTKAKKPENIKVKSFEQIGFSFNANSGKQVAVLLYDLLGLPIIDTTDTGLPATGADDIKKLINHTSDPITMALIKGLIGYSKAQKILSTFIPAFEQVQLGPDGIWYLFGNFNLGGTKSMRLSSSGPNLQNLPSGSTYGKLIKGCFISAHGWLFAGADFASLEAMVNAIVTKDPAKLGIYTVGYDSHSFNTYHYIPDQVPDIQKALTEVKSPDKFYKVTHEDGNTEFLTTTVMIEKGYLNEDITN